jgi:hypothetical protein
MSELNNVVGAVIELLMLFSGRDVIKALVEILGRDKVLKIIKEVEDDG